MKTIAEKIDEAFKLKGSGLTVAEAQLVHLMGVDDRYEIYLDDNGNVAYRLKI